MERLILIADDRDPSRELMVSELEEAGHRVIPTRDGAEAWSVFQEHDVDLVVTDLRMPRADGMSLLRRIRSSASRNAQVPVVMVSAFGSLSTAVAAGRSGVTDFYPLSEAGIAELLTRVDQILSDDRGPLPAALAGSSEAIHAVRKRLSALAELDSPVLILGEAGCGQDAAACYLHRLARSPEGLLRRVSCSPKTGVADLPRGGTAYLAHVDQTTSEFQTALWHELGAADRNPSNHRVRLLVSASTDLRARSEQGTFHRELARWLSRFTVELPPLRSRQRDIESVAEALLRKSRDRIGRGPRRLSREAMERLKAHPWHENVDELERFLEELAVLTRDESIDDARIDSLLRDWMLPLERIEQQRAREERERLLALYHKHGTFAGVARELGITRNAAKYRFRKYALLPPHPDRPER